MRIVIKSNNKNCRKRRLIWFWCFDPIESCPRFDQVITTVVKISFRSPDVAIENSTYCQIDINCAQNSRNRKYFPYKYLVILIFGKIVRPTVYLLPNTLRIISRKIFVTVGNNIGIVSYFPLIARKGKYLFLVVTFLIIFFWFIINTLAQDHLKLIIKIKY